MADATPIMVAFRGERSINRVHEGPQGVASRKRTWMQRPDLATRDRAEGEPNGPAIDVRGDVARRYSAGSRRSEAEAEVPRCSQEPDVDRADRAT